MSSKDSPINGTESTPILNGNPLVSYQGTEVESSHRNRKNSDTLSVQSDYSNRKTHYPLPPITLYKRRWLMLAVFSLTQFLCTVFQMTFACMSTVVLRYYHLDRRHDSWKVNCLAMAYMVAYVPMSLASSWVMKRFGLKASVFIAVMCNFVGSCIRFSGFKKGHELYFWIVFGGQCVTALAQPFVGNATTMLASNWFGEKERTTATTIATFLSILGSAAIFGVGPLLVGDASETGMMILLGSEAALACLNLVVFVLVFHEKPPSPPSYRHHHSRRASVYIPQPVVPVIESITYGQGTDTENDYESSEDEDIKSFSKLTIPIGPNNVHLEGGSSFTKDFWVAIKNIHFVFLMISFALGYAVVQSFSVMLDQIIVPMGYTEKDGSIFGITVIFCGMGGAAIMGIIADYTKRYKLLLCISGLGGLGAFTWFSVNMLYQKTPTRMILSCISIALLGIFACPSVPLTLELSVETTFPIPESISASILNALSTLVSAACILILDVIEKEETGSMQNTLWVCLGLLASALIATFLFNSKYKRLEFEKEKRTENSKESLRQRA
jgi:FLVCR family feline leukemia virus subgroup C receptor-related protein